MNMPITPHTSLVINPAAGNEPIILGARLGLGINKIRAQQGKAPFVIIILSAGERDRGVLQDELANMIGTEQIVLDQQGGSMLAPVVASQKDFATHISVLHNQYDRIQTALNARLGKSATQPFKTHDLSGNVVMINPHNIVGSLNTGGQIAIDTPQRDFAFPVVTSELLRAAPTPHSAIHTAVEERIRTEDRGYRNRFIPLVNTLSGSVLSEDSTVPMSQKFKELLKQSALTQAGEITFTPPMKSVAPAETFAGVTSEGVYAMLSGHGPGVDDIFRATLRAAKGAAMQVYTNPWTDEIAGVIRISPRALYDPRIKTAISRAGWGTGWQMLNSGKPWLVIPAQKGDDPEMELNNQVITSLGIGTVIKPDTFDAAALEHCITQFTPRVAMLRDLTTQHFGTSDGIAYIAERLAASYSTN